MPEESPARPRSTPDQTPDRTPDPGVRVDYALDREVAPGRGVVRDRRGRGMRGPALLPGPLAPRGVPARRSGGARFDAVVLAVVGDVESRWSEQLAPMELAVEEIPLLPESWSDPSVPLASFVEAGSQAGGSPPRLVLFRRPIEHRAETRADLEALVLTVVVEQLADFLGVSPEDVHPGYDPDA